MINQGVLMEPNYLTYYIIVAHLQPSNTVMCHGDFISATWAKDALKRSAKVNFLPLVDKPRSFNKPGGEVWDLMISTIFSTVSSTF